MKYRVRAKGCGARFNFSCGANHVDCFYTPGWHPGLSICHPFGVCCFFEWAWSSYPKIRIAILSEANNSSPLRGLLFLRMKHPSQKIDSNPERYWTADLLLSKSLMKHWSEKWTDSSEGSPEPEHVYLSLWGGGYLNSTMILLKNLKSW